MALRMVLINFSHPLTNSQIAQLSELTGEAISSPIELMPQFDLGRPFAEQITGLVDSVGLSPSEWQCEHILVNPPGYVPTAALLVAELHGRMGHFPPIIRLRPVHGCTPLQFEVAEIINLQHLRDEARQRRSQ